MEKNFLLVVKMSLYYSFLGIIFQSIVVSALFALPARGQDANIKNIRISMNVQNITFEEILKTLEKNSDLKFLYIEKEMPLKKRVTINVTDKSLYDVLQYLAKQYKLVFKLINNEVVIKKAPITKRDEKNIDPKPGRITGKITDATTGKALVGANIILEGTSIGAATDMDGNYIIRDIPPGTYSIKTSYIGYNTKRISVTLKSMQHIQQNFKLSAVAVKGETVTVTAQASGQNAAINQQLASDNIVNVVSAARIQQLPDANAAESVGRLPGVFLVRSFGEGSEIAIRGLQPKYNRVQIDGVEMPATSAGNRSVNMSMISSSMLSGIQLYKTVTPDMDAAVLGGTVNLQLAKAKVTTNGLPTINLWAQEGYNHLQNTFDDYRFVAKFGKRFFDNRFGILASLVLQKQNLTADILGGSYGNKTSSYYNPGPVILNDLNLTYRPADKHLTNGQLTTDYNWETGEINFMNLISQGVRSTKSFGQHYDMSANNINYESTYSYTITNVIMNILQIRQRFLSFIINTNLSHSYTENITPRNWSVSFYQGGGGISSVDNTQNPQKIAQQELAFVNLSRTYLQNISTSNNFTRQRNLTGSLNFEREVNFSNLFTANFKFGGKIRYTIRSYRNNDGGGNLYSPGNSAARAAVIAANLWMTQPPYNLSSNGNDRFPFSIFFNNTSSFGNFLNGNYTMIGLPTNLGVLSQIISTVINYQKTKPWYSGSAYTPNEYGNIASNYSGNELENAAYIMATFKIGPHLNFIPGVRYQGLKTLYTAAHIPNAYQNNTYPYPFPHKDTTVTEYHGFWLPDVILNYKPFSWFDIRAAYTNTLSYPDFKWLTPVIHIFVNTVDWNNYLVKPSHSQNYDLGFSIYNNSIGLFTINPFLKQIDNLIFSAGGFGITNPSLYSGLPSYTRGYILQNTQINDPYTVNIWGVEVNWQTHFWYLPSVLNGLVLNVNYTHIFSGAKYPFTITKRGGFPPTITYVDTFYTDRLIDQPSNIINFSVGYDYKQFSARVSMIFQSNVFSATNFYPQLRHFVGNYLRWDFSIKQALPLLGIKVYMDLNNINGEPDITDIQGNSFPTSENSYGLVGDLGLRWSLF